MNLKDFYNDVKLGNEEMIVFVKYGNFYRCFNNDAVIINYLFNYKLSEKNSTGFPIKSIDKVISILRNNNISCIVINDINNSYNFFLDKSKKNYTVNEGLSSICNESKELLIKNINNYNVIIRFIRSINK